MQHFAAIQSIDDNGNRIQAPIRYSGALSGRFYLEKWHATPDLSRYLPHCVATLITPEELTLTCNIAGIANERAFVYLHDVGLVRGIIQRTIGGRITMSIDSTLNDKNRISSAVLWLERRSKINIADKRSFPRYTPKNTDSSICYDNFGPASCTIANISPAGAAVLTMCRPDLHKTVDLGRIPGEVVRHTEKGFAMQFLEIQAPVTLEKLIEPLPGTQDPLVLQRAQILGNA